MNRRNLIPADRLRRRAVARATRRWAVALPTVGILLFAADLALSAALPRADATAAQAVRTAAAATAARAKATTVAAQVAAARAGLDAARGVSDQPDWGLLLAGISRALGDDGVLSTCRVSTDDAAAPLTVRLNGVARSQPAVAGFALRLERTGVFDRVDLRQTTPAQFLGTDAVGFELVCTVGGVPGTADAGRRP